MRVATIVVCMLFSLSACVVVTDSREHGHDNTYHTHRGDQVCDSDPHGHAPDYCEMYEGRDCCEWYVGEGCYEKWCHYHHNCEWHYYGTECY